MRRSLRQLTGAIVIICFLPAYALIALLFAQARALQEAPAAVQLICLAVLGLAWILPVMPLIKWMERPDPRS